MSVTQRLGKKTIYGWTLVRGFINSKGGRMTVINLEEAKINIEGQWLSAEDLTNMIQENIYRRC